MCSADFFVPFGTELRDDQISLFIEEKEPVTVFKRFPEPLTGIRF
jgi:hypothetical protein